jgi:hypothetical protein
MSDPNAPAIAGQPRLILRLEGGALFLAALYAFMDTHLGRIGKALAG